MQDHVALIIIRDNKTLFVRRSLKKKALPGLWAFASGTIEMGETPLQTAKREVKEELNLDLKSGKVIAVEDLAEMKTRLHFVVCEVLSGEPTICEPDEIEEFAWMNFNEFFHKFSDDQIGHGLIWLRANPKIWQAYNL